MDPEGIAPSFPVCDAGVLLLDDEPGCRPAELNRVRPGFSEACDRHTRAAWMGHQDSNLKSPGPGPGVLPVTPCPSGASDGTRTRYGRRDKPVPRRLWLRMRAGWAGITTATPDLESGMSLVSPPALDGATGVAPASPVWKTGALLLSYAPGRTRTPAPRRRIRAGGESSNEPLPDFQ